MVEQRGSPTRDDHEDNAMAPAVLWGIVVSLGAALLGALVLATAMRFVESLRPSPSSLLAIMLAAVAIGSLWASHRTGRAGLLAGGLTGLGFTLLGWLLVMIMQLGPLTLLGLLQALVAGAVVGAVAGIIGVNL